MKLSLEKINYSYKDLAPVMSEDTLKYHRDKLAAGYIKRFNAEEGDTDFNEAGAFMHNLFFPQLKSPKGANKPAGSSLELIEDNFGSFDSFKQEFTKLAQFPIQMLRLLLLVALSLLAVKLHSLSLVQVRVSILFHTMTIMT